MDLLKKLFGTKSNKQTSSRSLSEKEKNWLQVIDSRVAAMPMEMIGIMFKSAEDLGAMHCVEYQSNVGGMSAKEQFETALDRVNVLENLKDHIALNCNEAQKFHYEASVIGAKQYLNYLQKAKKSEKVSKNAQNRIADNGSHQRVNYEDVEDIGMVTHYNNKPYTGIIFDIQNDTLSEEWEYLEGLKHGVGRVYDLNGELLGEIKYANDEFQDKSHEKKYWSLQYEKLSPLTEYAVQDQEQHLFQVKLLVSCKHFNDAREKLEEYHFFYPRTEESTEFENQIKEGLEHPDYKDY